MPRTLCLFVAFLLPLLTGAVVLDAGYNPFLPELYIPPPAQALENMRKRSVPSTIQLHYSTPITPEAQACVEFAATIMSALYDIPANLPVRFNFTWTPLGAGLLGQATGFQVGFGHNRDFQNNVCMAIANIETGEYLNVKYPTSGLSAFDINAEFNSVGVKWYFGTDGKPPADSIDFVSVLLHEFHHGFGFAGSLIQSNVNAVLNTNFQPIDANRFDMNLVFSNGTALSLLSNGNKFPTKLYSALTSSTIYFETGNPAYGKVKMYCPKQFMQGTSIYHLDNTTYYGGPHTLMTPFMNNGHAIHHPGNITLTILQKVGWRLTPGAFSYTTAAATSITGVTGRPATTTARPSTTGAKTGKAGKTTRPATSGNSLTTSNR